MSFSLNENQKKSLARLIRERLDEQLSRFPYARFPERPLNDWRAAFADPKSVDAAILKSALSWQCGAWQRRDKPYAHKKLEIIAIQNWSDFVETLPDNPADIFDFWQDKFGDSGNVGFDVAAFLCHLLSPEAIELVDTHRLCAMSDLLAEIEHDEKEVSENYDYGNLERYTEFFRQLLPKLQTNLGERAPLQLGRFLKAYGNRNTLARVIGRSGPTVEPEFPDLDWESSPCTNYDLSQISAKANADVLFACLLLSLDRKEPLPDTLTVGEIVGALPLGTGNICNPASYHYALIAMFGAQKKRDFFEFEDDSLRESFTQQANQATRDMRFYAKYSDVSVSINPRYRKEA
ncbi:hypothetical protein [Saccharibacillus kuerlensis]|uniref:Uncharacterized protein n=1 Tax=Saccharibacillus kuerlensis TaxID=459527 RepID=A0ABQ2KVY7_9BACL|nr:hypothetical protein [Saccharibacillus kuerlensis]GGN94985.1 hypothetical protein GCM10010969_10230 [Saccharibacillus kuerlensis]